MSSLLLILTGLVVTRIWAGVKIRHNFGVLAGAVRALSSRRRARRIFTACGVGDGTPKVVGVVPTPNGAIAQIIPTLGQTTGRWRSAADALALALGVPVVDVVRDGPHAIDLVLTVRDVLRNPLPLNVIPASEDWRLWLGIDDNGNRVDIHVPNTSAMVVGGVPGSGKSVALLGLLGQWAGRTDVSIAVVDGKSGGDWQVLRYRSWAYEDDVVGVEGLEKARDLLLDVHRAMQSRLKLLKQSPGSTNFWTVSPQRAQADLPLLVTVIDECQTIFDGRLHIDKEARRLCGECAGLVEELVKRGRSAGMLTILATQKPTAESLPTGIRDNAGLRIAFSVKSRPAAEAILGDAWSNESPVSPVGAPVGVAILGPSWGPLQRVRTPLYSERAIATAFSRSSGRLDVETGGKATESRLLGLEENT